MESLGSSFWSPPSIDNDEEEQFQQNNIVKLFPDYKPLPTRSSASIVYCDVDEVDDKKSIHSRRKYKTKKFKELRKLKPIEKVPVYNKYKNLNKLKFVETSILSQLDLSQSIEFKNDKFLMESSSEIHEQQVEVDREQNTNKNENFVETDNNYYNAIKLMSRSLNNLSDPSNPIDYSRGSNSYAWSMTALGTTFQLTAGAQDDQNNDDGDDDIYKTSPARSRSNTLTPFDDNIFSRQITPLPSFYESINANNVSDGLSKSTQSMIQVPLKFKPPKPSAKYSKRERYGEFDLQENPIVSVKLETAENEMTQLRSDLEVREQEFLDKFKAEQLLMISRMQAYKNRREDETRKTAETSAQMSKLRKVSTNNHFNA